ACGAGIVALKAGAFKKLFDFRLYSTTLSRNWVWTPDLSWSPASDLLIATIHGKPYTNEPEETSPIFNVEVAQVGGLYEVPLVPKAGMWAAPSYSPRLDNAPDAKSGYIAYLKARNPIDSVSSEYDLVVADRDGSNATILFPGKDKPGLKPIDNLIGNLFGNEITWSPDGHQVAIVYQGDIWIVDVESGRANQVTLVSNVHHPRWV